MGLGAAALLTLLGAVPLVGGLLVGFAAPVLLAGSLVTIDALARRSEPVRREPRLAVLRRSPLLLLAFFSMAALAIHLAVWLVAGSVWSRPWTELGGLSAAAVALAFALALALGLLLAASLIYALPLALLRADGLGTAVALSWRASRHHASALALPLLLALAPLVLRALAQTYSPLAAPLAGVLAGGLALPLAATSPYCSYRSLFPVTSPGSRSR